ncbi:MAG: 5-methyltetrahydrofolate--homocysteine methyltransferase [Lachnospiraceae bacterium]|nr:5-methyltetrahydrofolate--homocysteine methyltransferase [Lachnospiraceae bacterium]
MTKEEFKKLAEKNILYLDGATGSNLVKAGMPAGVCPEDWILKHSDVMLKLQKDYVKAGSDILYAPTFTANRIKLAEYGLENQMEEMIQGLVQISKEAAASAEGRKVYVAGDLTMTGQTLKPMGTMELEDLIEIYKEQIRMLDKAGVDLLIVETMMSLAETRAALIAAKEVTELPVMVTLTFEADGRTLYGTDAKTAGIVTESLGACAIGANCSTGPAHMEKVISDLASVTTIPVIAKPNAGLPFLDADGKTCYNMTAPDFVEEMEILVKAGASVLGGCCGTDPSFIQGLKERFETQRKVSVSRRPEGVRYLSSERQTLAFGLNDLFMIVGERINPTGKKALQAQLREGSLEKVLQFAEEQEAAGAQVLDVNMGMSGIDEKAMMLRCLEEISGVTNLPLSLDSSHVSVLEAALRHYPGRALINSISYESEKFEKLLPIAAKYGAAFILLPLSDEGLPKDLDEKKDIIEKIYARAKELGMRKEDIIVDGLVATIGANKKAALECLETVRYAKSKGFATICGLSNISFGMPERGYVNTAFLALMIEAGLTMAISNPSQEMLVSCAFATDVLLNKEGADLRYIEYASFVKEQREKKEAELQEKLLAANQATVNSSVGDAEKTVESKSDKPSEKSNGVGGNAVREALYKAVMKGNRNGIAKLTQDALNAGEAPSSLLNEILLPGINEVGELFDKGKYFLPQLIASAEAMKNAIEVLEPLLLSDQKGEDMPVVVIATVEGDIHDIGKNLVALMLKNYGFQVIDLGKDVPASEIIAAAKEHHAKIIALSALMTTTMQRMREVVEEVKKIKLPVKVMIGGAVITQEYADEIGADGYSRDAADAVKLAKRLNSEP